ncbi:putative RNA-directed DNA polymerase [Tanacetum coccineum]
MSMTIQSSVKDKILATSSETSKSSAENYTVGNLSGTCTRQVSRPVETKSVMTDDQFDVPLDEISFVGFLWEAKHQLYVTIVCYVLLAFMASFMRILRLREVARITARIALEFAPDPSHHGYRCLDISTERLYITRHVRFNEAQFPFDIPKTTSAPPSKTSPYYSSESPYVIPTTDHPSPSSPRSPILSPSSVSHLSRTSQTFPESSNGQPSPVSTTSISPPPPPPPTTRQPMKEEYDALMKNETWSLVPRASNTNVADGKWVYKLKRDKNGVITCYKARFVAKGFRQQPGIDFHETFSPVVKSTTIRAVLSLAVTNNWPLRQLDVHNAFLHENLKEQVYMKQPPAFIDPQRPNHVCLLHKSLYGLKPLGLSASPKLSSISVSKAPNGSTFVYFSRGHTLLYILVYVDDIIVTGNNKGTINNIISQRGSAFALKDLVSLNYFLGIEIVPHVSGILLSQKKYILKLLQSGGLSNCNPVSYPTVTPSSLSLDDSATFSNPVKYRQVVGSLQYVNLSRPDIAFAVNKVCQYMHASTENHWFTVKRILRYLHGTVEHDADWAGDSDDRRSTGGFSIYLGSNLISWTARKQCTISRSTTEAEYKALADTVAELTWLQALLYELDPYGIDSAKAKRTLKNLRVKTSPTNAEYKITGMSEKPCKEHSYSHFESFVAGHFINRAHDIIVACKSYKKGQQVGFLAGITRSAQWSSEKIFYLTKGTRWNH